jgi:hypothetical protein
MSKEGFLTLECINRFPQTTSQSETVFSLIMCACIASGDAGAAWETVIDNHSFNNYDNFEAIWNYLYPWGSDHNGSARMYGSSYDHNHIYLNNGVLTLKASQISWDEGNSSSDPYLPINYHSGAIHAKHKILINDNYPNYELKARIQAPSSHGTWPAFWLTGADSWPPESDIMEFKGSNVNWQNTYTGSWQTKKTTVSNPGQWHTYRVWITKANDTDVTIHYYIDDQWQARHTANFVNKPMWIILNLQMEGSSGNSGPDTDTYLRVDWLYVGRTVKDSDALTNYTFCADESEICYFSGTHDVAYGVNGQFYYQTATDRITCNNDIFGDPVRGTRKACYVSN